MPGRHTPAHSADTVRRIHDRWRPLLSTPPSPDYPCALPTGADAGAEALRRFFGTDNVAYTRSVPAPVVALPEPMAACKPMTRHFDSLSEAVEEAASARVYASIHFRSGCYAGARMDRQVAHFAYTHLKRMKASRGRPGIRRPPART